MRQSSLRMAERCMDAGGDVVFKQQSRFQRFWDDVVDLFRQMFE